MVQTRLDHVHQAAHYEAQDCAALRAASGEIYGRTFALAYKELWEDRFAVPMSRWFPKIRDRFGIRGDTFADIACGTGRFAYELAKQGYRGIGIDLSPHLIEIARERTAKTDLPLRFEVGDMRDFELPKPVDFITCWYDSVNYLASLEEVKSFFTCCHRALKPGGVLLFDIETEVGFRDRWRPRASGGGFVKQFGGLIRRGRFCDAYLSVRDTWRSRNGWSVRTFRSSSAWVQATSRLTVSPSDGQPYMVTELFGWNSSHQTF